MTIAEALGKDTKPIVIRGIDFTVSPLTLNDLSTVQDELGSADEEGSKWTTIEGMKFILWVKLNKHQEVTLEEAGELMTIENMDELMDELGLSPVEKNGEAE